jgi:hypothetical protein
VYKVCRQCGGEYQSWVSVCPECNVALDWPRDELAPAPAREQHEPAPIADPVVLRFEGPEMLTEIAEALQEQGIASRIAPHEQAGARLAIYVSRAHAPTAFAISEQVIARSLHVDADELVDYGPGACPACGEPMPETATACASCGLEFPEIEPDPGGR